MDFTVIENHPWATTAVIGLGGLGLYLLLRGSGGSSGGDTAAGSGQAVYASGPSDASVQANAAQNVAQIQSNAQTTALSAQLAALGIQSDAQIKAAQIGAEVTDRQTDAALTSDLYTTAATLTYGLSSQGAAIELAKIQAGVQQSYIDKMSGGAIAQSQTPIRAAVPTPEPLVQPNGANYTIPYPVTAQTPAGVGPVIPGGTPLIAWPNYSDCDPFDSACVARNQGMSNQYGADVAAAQATNNRNQVLANYQISIDAGTITAAQQADYQRILTGAAS